MTTTPPGWYDDGYGALRWWDGARWTEHVAEPSDAEAPVPGAEPAEPEPSAAPAAAYAPPPGADAGGGAFTAATQPRSRLWIVWVVVGVVLLGLVIAAAILIPLLILSNSAGSGAAQSDGERAAVGTVERYDDAWQGGECDDFTSSTTEEFRAASGFTDCATFEADAARFDENFDDYELAVTDVETQGDQIVVSTEETYLALVDESGAPIDPARGTTTYHYTLVQSGGDWLIDDLAYEDDAEE